MCLRRFHVSGVRIRIVRVGAIAVQIRLRVAVCAVNSFAHRRFRADTLNRSTGYGAINFRVIIIASDFQSADRTLAA